MYVFVRHCADCGSNFFVTPDGSYFDASGVIGSYYKDGFLFTPQDDPSAIIISKLDEEKKEFTPVKSIVTGTNFYILGVDQYHSIYIGLSPLRSPYYMAKISFNDEKKEIFQIPQKYFSEKIKTDIFIADSGNIFILTLDSTGTASYTKIVKCYISNNSE